MGTILILMAYFVAVTMALGMLFLPGFRTAASNGWRRGANKISVLARALQSVGNGGAARAGESSRRVAGALVELFTRQARLMAAALAVLMLLPALAVIWRHWHALETFDHTDVRIQDERIAALLVGERLVPPAALPPEIFTTRDVELSRPMVRFASRDWDLLDQVFAQRLLMVFRIMREQHGYEMVLLEGYRSPQRQEQLAAMGGHVTQAGAFRSYHQFGLAADSAFLRNGKVVISEQDAWAMRGYLVCRGMHRCLCSTQKALEALDAQRGQGRAQGTMRTAAPGSHFLLSEHPLHSGLVEARDRLVILRAKHRARNNLKANHKAQVLSLLGAIVQDKLGVTTAEIAQDNRHSEEDAAPLYQCELQTQALAQPVRMAQQQSHALSAHLPVVRLHQYPTINGVQTALVVGLGEAVHTDRDQRIKVQFHWQRGAGGGHRLEHPSADNNAPTNDASGTWVRVATPVAGQNWGSVFTPRVGQEVLVAFLSGDIDRPVVIGSVYNGQGQKDAQGNQVARGGSGSTGNAPAWFAGSGHNAVLSGLKSQELPSSQSGMGGHNQLVFDDTPGQGRIELSTTQAATRLQLGHLLQQNDNQRLRARGHGCELATRAWGAVRAGSGLLISGHGKPASVSGSEQQQDSLKACRGSEAEADQANQNMGGGEGGITVWSRAELVLAAPAGIVQSSPADGVTSAGNTLAVVAGQDIHQLSAKNWALAGKDGRDTSCPANEKSRYREIAAF